MTWLQGTMAQKMCFLRDLHFPVMSLSNKSFLEKHRITEFLSSTRDISKCVDLHLEPVDI